MKFYYTFCFHFSGSAFDIREFHGKILEMGPVSLETLIRHLEEWLDPLSASGRQIIINDNILLVVAVSSLLFIVYGNL